LSSAQRTRSAGKANLYPFLYSDVEADHSAVLDELTRSAAAKIADIVTLRRDVVATLADRLVECAGALADAVSRGGRLFTFGNGGSSSDAQQVAMSFLRPAYGTPVAALSLSMDGALVTALSNDAGFEIVFARQLAAFGRPHDVAFGLSTSGGSANVLRAFAEADRIGMLTIGLAGYGGGAMAELDSIDYLFSIPSSSVHRIQETQTTLYHLLWELTQQALTQQGLSQQGLTYQALAERAAGG
jgi:D-sedoheptulose 7-phosphate isomerase